MIINVNASKILASEYKILKLQVLNERQMYDYSGVFIASVIITNKISKQKISKTIILNNTLNNHDLSDIRRTLHLKVGYT